MLATSDVHNPATNSRDFLQIEIVSEDSIFAESIFGLLISGSKFLGL